MDYENLTPQYRIEEYLEAIVSGWVDATKVAYPEVPSWRIEEFLDAFITYIWEDGDHPRKPCPEPVWRLEECLRAIYDVMTGAATPWAFPTPTNRIEEYLAAIHAYLADGTELPVPEPVWRIEQWLAYVLEGAKEGGGIEKTVSGSLVHITNALAKAALSVLVSIEPIQDLHGYSSPWPAGGGVNILPTIDQRGDGFINDYRLLSDGTTTFMGTYYISQYFPVTPGKTYTYSVKDYGSETTSCAAFYDSEYNFISAITGKPTGNEAVAPSNAAYMRASNTKAGADLYYTLNEGPYANICPISGRTGLSVYVSPTQDQQDATTYAVDWTTEAGTVYGGTVDVVTGLLTVDRAIVDLGTLTWGYRSSGSSVAPYFHANYGEKIAYPGALYTYPIDAVCSQYKVVVRSGATFVDYTLCGDGGLSVDQIQVKDPRYTDAATFKTAMSGVQLCYELATPLTYQLTGQEVQMLLGENYLWPSSGDTVSVTYYAEGNANPLQSLNILLGGNYSNPKTADDVSDKEALDIILGGNK